MKITRLLLVTIAVLILIFASSPTSSANLIINTPIEDVPLEEDQIAPSEINLNDHFSSDLSPIHFSWVSCDNKVEVTIHEDGSVDLSAPENWYGSDEVTFIASDGEHEISDTILVTVEPKNDAPERLVSLSDQEFNEDTVLEEAINLHNHYMDIDGTVSFSSSSNYIIVQIDESGLVDLSAPKDWHGSEEITFTASDGEADIIDTILVTVVPVNDAPNCASGFTSISINGNNQEKTLDLKGYFTDVDNDILTYQISGNNRIKTEINQENGKLKLTVPDDWTGEEILIVTAKDTSGESTSMHMVVIVTQPADSFGQIFYMLGLVLAVAITGVRLHFAGKRRSVKSPVKLDSYRYYNGN
ncbi:MAG: hypothetical protein JSW00_11925 [Thermoplasmata archaeon]|nr:MAG: hypothetical protein JSW00_11925 [Thermoplasmata archaeon]